MAFLDTPTFKDAVIKALLGGATHYSEHRIKNNELVSVTFFNGDEGKSQKFVDMINKHNNIKFSLNVDEDVSVLCEVGHWIKPMQSYTSLIRLNTIEKEPLMCLGDLDFVPDLIEISDGIATMTQFAYNMSCLRNMIMNAGEGLANEKYLYKGYAHKINLIGGCL